MCYLCTCLINCGATVKIAFMFCVAFGLGFEWHSAPVVVPTRVATRQIAKYFVDIAENFVSLNFLRVVQNPTWSYAVVMADTAADYKGLLEALAAVKNATSDLGTVHQKVRCAIRFNTIHFFSLQIIEWCQWQKKREGMRGYEICCHTGVLSTKQLLQIVFGPHHPTSEPDFSSTKNRIFFFFSFPFFFLLLKMLEHNALVVEVTNDMIQVRSVSFC